MTETNVILNLDYYQEVALSTDLYPNNDFKLGYLALGLTGEAGETADKIKKVYRDNNGVFTSNTREAIAKEIGDTLWYASVLASKLGYSLSTIATMNANKLKKRVADDTIHGQGDNR